MKITEPALQVCYNLLRNFGVSDASSETLSTVAVEAMAAALPMLVCATLPAPISRVGRARAAWLSTLWGVYVQSEVHAQVVGWVRDRAAARTTYAEAELSEEEAREEIAQLFKAAHASGDFTVMHGVFSEDN